MIRRHIIRMAQEVGGICDGFDWWKLTTSELERFAELVAAEEREACAKLLDKQWFRTQTDCSAAIRAKGQA